jgi:hypothetical protein
MTSTQPQVDIAGRPVIAGPADASSPAATASYVTGVADGNLATPVKLRDFLFGLGVVYRLPKKAKAPKDAAAGTRRFSLAVGVRVRRFALALAPVAVAAAGYVVYRQFASVPMPAEVIGTWSTEDGRYKGRSFWLNPDAVAFQNGPAQTQFAVHQVKRVKAAHNADTLVVNIDYEADGKAATLSLAYRGQPLPELRLVNQPKVQWRRSGGAPVVR